MTTIPVLSLLDASLPGGATSTVFMSPDGRAVHKLFRRFSFLHDAAAFTEDDEVIVRALWKSQCAAYEAVHQLPDVRRFFPRYFGACSVGDVRDERGDSVAGDYLLDCCYTVERIRGREYKGHELPDAYCAEAKRLNRAIEHVVRDTGDASYFVEEASGQLKMIDFGAWDAVSDLSLSLISRGRLPEHVRRMYLPNPE